MSHITFFINLSFYIAIIRNIFLIFLTFFRRYQIFTRLVYKTCDNLFVIVRCITIISFGFNEVITIKGTFRPGTFFHFSQFFLGINVHMTSHDFHIIVFRIAIRQFFRMVKTITWKVFLRFFALIKSYNILTSHLINVTGCNLFIDMTGIAIIITCRFIITVIRNVLLRRRPFFKRCDFSATMTIYKTCHHLTILVNNITITIFTGFNVTIIWNIIFLRLDALF